MYKYILFDLDGTIVDSKKGIFLSAKYTLNKYNIKVKSNEELLKFIGPPLKYSFSEFYGFDEDESLNAVEIYRNHYKRYSIYKCDVYQGIKDLFIKLKENGYELVLATNKLETYASKILKRFDLEKYFTLIVGTDEKGTLTNKTKVINSIISKLNINNNEAIMIGDKKQDLEGAKNNKIDFMGVTYGFGSVNEFENYPYVDSPLKILDIIEKN